MTAGYPGSRIWLRHAEANRHKLKLVQDFARGESLLDIGCAQGWYGLEAERRGMRVVYSDVARDIMPALRDKFVEASATALPFDDGAFDTTLALDVIEHVEDEDRALRELARVTTQRLIVSVPSASDGALHRYNLTYKHHIDKTHQREYDAAELVEKLQAVGFRHVAVRKAGPVAPHMIVEFIRPGLLRRLTGWAIVALWRARLLRSDLYADLYAIADKPLARDATTGR